MARPDGRAPLTPPDQVRLRTIFRRFWPETREFRGRFWISLLLVSVAPALSTAELWIFKILIDRVVVPHDFTLFPLLAGSYLGLALVQAVVSFTDQYLSTWVGERFVLNLRTRLFAHLHRLSLGFFEQRPLGDVLSRLTGDISAIEELVLSGVAQSITYLLQILMFTGALFYLDWRLAGAALLAAPGFLLFARFFSRRIKDASREKRRRAGALTAVAEESFANHALVRAYDRADQEGARFHEQNLAGFAAQVRATRLQALFGPITDVLEVVGVLSVLGLAVWELANQRITIGGLLAFVAYLTQLYSPIQSLGRLTNSVYSASASAERVIELLDETPSVTDPVAPRRLDRARGTVRFDDVGFTYPGGTSPALAGLSFTVAPGAKVAIVGGSGAGKSTLTKLLLRFYDPDSGAITLDGIDLRELTLADLYRNIATVLQETLVFDGTVADNILWGRPDATPAQVVEAARAADAHEFILALPDGYDTRIGQRGRMLSGGQRQRLAIARAMIRDAPVLLLDEPTTGLDAESSQRVLAPLRRLMAGRTTIIISHNLLTLTDADQILFLEHGQLVGAGRHARLLATIPAYAHLYRLHQQPAAGPPLPRTEPVPARMSPRIPTQGCVAVLGPPGSGKSVLLTQLAQSAERAGGTVLVPQHLPPAHGSIARYIHAGHPGSTVADVHAAARAAGVHEFITALPRAYATLIGPHERPLPPAQTRRIALARALVGNPAVLLLDEPTAGLDQRARNDLLGTLCVLTARYPTLLTTCDPVVAALTDRIVHLDHPRPGPSPMLHC